MIPTALATLRGPMAKFTILLWLNWLWIWSEHFSSDWKSTNRNDMLVIKMVEYGTGESWISSWRLQAVCITGLHYVLSSRRARVPQLGISSMQPIRKIIFWSLKICDLSHKTYPNMHLFKQPKTICLPFVICSRWIGYCLNDRGYPFRKIFSWLNNYCYIHVHNVSLWKNTCI